MNTISYQVVVVFILASFFGPTATSSKLRKPSNHRVFVDNTNAVCRRELVGLIRFQAAEKRLEICDGNKWLSVDMKDSTSSEYGHNVKTPGASCKDILQKNRNTLKDGIYWIKLNHGDSSTFPVYCDMQSGGWTMVFKMVSGIRIEASKVWMTGYAVNEFKHAALNPSNQFKKPYKNRIVQYWSSNNPTEARVVLYRAGRKVLQISFNAKNSNKLSWFAMSRVTDSPWSDLAREPKNYFSIKGHSGLRRQFMINRNYGGCRGDNGWLISTYRVCPWEKRHTWPVFLYSKTGTYANWSTHKNVGVADVLSVYVK